MDFCAKKLLVLCGNVVHVKVVEAAKEMGIYTVVADSLPLDAAPAKRIADEALYINVLDVDALEDYCIQNHIDGIINYCNDIGQKPYQELCERLKLPCFGNKEQLLKLTDKVEFKKMCALYGVDTIPEYSENALDEVSYPVFVKPIDSRGSRGQAVCYNKTELGKAIIAAKLESTNGNVLIEKYMEGYQDFSVSYLFVNGEGIVVGTKERYQGDKTDDLAKQCVCAISPSKYSEMYMELVNDRVIKMFKGIGIKNAPVFMQGFIDGDTVRFYDPGLRYPGGEYDSCLEKATGVNLMKELIAFSLGGGIDLNLQSNTDLYMLNGKRAVQINFFGVGTIGNIKGIDKLADNSNVVRIGQRRVAGETVNKTGDVRQRLCEIAFLCENNEIESMINTCYDTVDFLNEKNESILVSKFNLKI